MPFRICKTFELENGHMLSKHPDKCRFPHGHSRTVEFVLEAATLDANDMVCDFKVLKEAMEAFLDQYDHAMCVSTDDPKHADLKAAYGDRIISFDGVDPTTEVLAKIIYGECQQRLRQYAGPYPLRADLRLVKVRLSETSSTWAEYWE